MADHEFARPLTRRWGLEFCDPAVEAAYDTWREQHVLPFVRLAFYSGMTGSLSALLALLFAPLHDLRPTGIPLMLLLLVVHAAGIALTHTPWTWLVTPTAVGVNVVSGASAVVLTLPADNFAITAAAVIFIAYTGLAMSRLRPRLALVALLPTIAFADAAGVLQYARGDASAVDLVAGLAIITAALSTGLVLCLAIERVTRSTYADQRLIAAQSDALFEERTNLARFLAPQVAQAIRERGLQGTLRTELASLTAVSIDLRGFTAFTDRHGPEPMTNLLERYYAAVVESSRSFGGTLHGFAGDGALILLGAPWPREDHAEAGFALARVLRDRVTELIAPHADPGAALGLGVGVEPGAGLGVEVGVEPGAGLGVGLGVASGDCAVGVIAAMSRLEYAVVGSPVNLASRLCAAALHGQILIAPDTVARLPQLPHWTSAALPLKGFRQPVTVTIDALRVLERTQDD